MIEIAYQKQSLLERIELDNSYSDIASLLVKIMLDAHFQGFLIFVFQKKQDSLVPYYINVHMEIDYADAIRDGCKVKYSGDNRY